MCTDKIVAITTKHLLRSTGNNNEEELAVFLCNILFYNHFISVRYNKHTNKQSLKHVISLQILWKTKKY